MLFSADLTPELDRSQFTASAERLRRIAARLKALAETSRPSVWHVWSFGGYNPGAAADAVAGYAYSFDPTQRRRFRADVEKALRFKLWNDTQEGQRGPILGDI